METPNQGLSEKRIELSTTGNKAVITFNNLALNAQNPTSPEILLTIEKNPIRLVEGKSYCNSAVKIDKETSVMQALASQAESLQTLPEEKRPRAVMNLFRSQVHYAYNDVVAKLAESNPDLAEWIAKNIGLNSFSGLTVPLSELIEKKYGICRHLAVGYLWLAQKAGLEGIIMTSNHNVIKNVTRRDNGEKLFKSIEVGKTASAHAWVEIKLSDGRWIPADPTTKLVGDTEEELDVFRQANYFGRISDCLDLDSGQKELSPWGKGLGFKPGEKTAQVGLGLELVSAKPTIIIGGQNIPPTNEPYRGAGRLLVKTTEDEGKLKLKIVEAK